MTSSYRIGGTLQAASISFPLPAQSLLSIFITSAFLTALSIVFTYICLPVCLSLYLLHFYKDAKCNLFHPFWVISRVWLWWAIQNMFHMNKWAKKSMNKLLIWIPLLGKGKSKNRGEGSLGFTCIQMDNQQGEDSFLRLPWTARRSN